MVVGTAALILVLSVFNGFEGLVKSLYSNFYTDLRIRPDSGKMLVLSAADLNRIRGMQEVRNLACAVEEKALLQNGEYQSVVYLKGVDENYRYISGVADNLLGGFYDIGTAETPRLILGAGVENALGVVADKNIYRLSIYLGRRGEREQLNPLEDIHADTIRTSAAFRIQQDFDNKYAITHIGFLRRALRLPPDTYSSVEIALRDPRETESVKAELRKWLPSNVVVENRYEQNRSLYSVMKTERWVIYGILCLILVVAAFNMIGALTMLVLEKQKDISILHALGGSRSFLQRVFLTEGILLAVVGGSVGMLLALLLAWAQVTWHLVPLQGGSFLISYFPVQLKLADFLLVGATVFVIALLASWLPARKAARQAFSLRSE